MSNLVAREIRIYNSGLILFWPFLARFFEQSGLLIDGEFFDDLSRNRAVYLLQQLVNNRIDIPAHELALNKLLVGLPIMHQISPIAELAEEEMELCISLLKGLRENWDKVKNSSIDGIQETFLQREGFLKIIEDSAVLTIDKNGVDVLLNSLPWDISLIKLPWMQKPIHIEWL